MIIYTNNIISNYIDKGFAPVPIPFKTKAPIIKGWPTLSISADNVEQYFGDAPTNIGILTGKASGGLVDVDIDDDDALKFAPHFLPATDYVFGRSPSRTVIGFIGSPTPKDGNLTNAMEEWFWS